MCFQQRNFEFYENYYQLSLIAANSITGITSTGYLRTAQQNREKTITKMLLTNNIT